MEKELDQLATVKVAIYGDPSPSVKVQVKEGTSVSAATLYEKVCQLIGLGESSWEYFALFEGHNSPTRRYQATDSIDLLSKDITLRKWVFEDVKERTLFEDSVATDLLYKHAAYDIRIGNLKPSAQISKQLEECLNPDFPSETQYLSVCQRLPGYGCETFRKCVLMEDHQNLQHMLPKDSVADLSLSKTNLLIVSGKANLELAIPWRNIQSWSISEEHSAVNFDLMVLGSRSKITFKTPQYKLLLSVLMEIIKLLMKDDKKLDVVYYASDIKRTNGWTTYNNHLYEPGLENPVFEHSPTYEEPTWSSI